MDLNELKNKVNNICIQYVGELKLDVVDEDGNKFNNIIFDIKNNKAILIKS